MDNHSLLIVVECVYASPSEQTLVVVKVREHATIEEVIFASGLLHYHPGLVLHELSVGIFSQHKTLQDTVKAGDRVEIYRPLLIDPMEARRQRAPAPKRRKF